MIHQNSRFIAPRKISGSILHELSGNGSELFVAEIFDIAWFLKLSRFSNWSINGFVPNGPFLYPLKTSETLTVFCCFKGVEKGWLATNGLMVTDKSGETFRKYK